MNYFGLGPSKKIGLIKDAIKEAILDGEISNEFEAAFEKMKNEGERLGLNHMNKAYNFLLILV